MEKLNKYLTSLEDLNLEKQPKEILELFYDFFYNVPYILNIVSDKRLYAKDLPRDKDGKIIIDITKPHILENMDYFRPSAIYFLLHGKYTDLRPNPNPNSEYGKWIREEVRRCHEGYVRESDGEWVTGDYYFFLNYCPMSLVKKNDAKSKKGIRVIDFPSIWDGHYYKFHYINLAREHGLHAIELSSRSRGKSFSGAALLAKRFILGESKDVNKKVTCYAAAAEKKYLVAGDLTLDKFLFDIDFIADNTEFPRKRLINTIQNMLWVMGYQDLDSGTKKGTLNSVIGVTAKDDESKLRGTRGVLYIIEEGGSFPRLLLLWNNLLPSVEFGSDTFGLLYSYGTAGDDLSDFYAMSEMMYHPDGYHVYGIDNVYDISGKGGNKFSFFFPGYMNLANCYDENGNSDVTKALLEILHDRYLMKYNSTDINAVAKRTAEIPIVPLEAIMRTHRNIFPITLINERIVQLETDSTLLNDVSVGELVLSGGDVKFNPTNDLPIRIFPLKDNKVHGAIEFFRFPEKDSNGRIPWNRYIAGHDPVDFDSSSSLSLSSTFVLDTFTDTIACEYTGRQDFAEDNYEILRRICLFYNCLCLYEAHPYSQKVITPDGVKLWKDINIGDRLFSINGKIVRVTDIPIDEEMPIYKVTLNDGRIVRCSDNHIWNVYVLNKHINKTINIKTSKMIEYGIKNKFGQHNFFIPNGGAVEYDYKEVSVDPYSLGLLIAEGAFSKFRHSKVICKYNYEEHIPDAYIYNSYDVRMNLLKGLMDGNGHAIKRGACTYITSSEQLRDDIMLLCRSLGMNCKYKIQGVRMFKIFIYADKHIFRLQKNIEKQYIYKFSEKDSEVNLYINKIAIESIEYDCKEMGKCVTVDSDDGLYMIGDYVVTHNCNLKGLFSYFSRMNCLYLLADTPEYLRDKDIVKFTNGVGNTTKGVMATKTINDYANKLIRDWLLLPKTKIEVDKEGKEYETTILNLSTIKNLALLKELSLYTPDTNVDRIRSLGLLMIFRELIMINCGGELDKEKTKHNEMANDDFFTRNYDGKKLLPFNIK